MSDADMEDRLAAALLDARQRCARQGLIESTGASLSLRLPGAQEGLLLVHQASSTVLRWDRNMQERGGTPPGLALHRAIYARRGDVGAILAGGGRFGSALADLGGVMPVAFDEQARHLGRMRGPAAAATDQSLASAIGTGANAVLIDGMPVCLGTTCQRMVLNAELFEKCAKAYVLAACTGQAVTTLPWWVCRIAIGRLRKDQSRAAQRFAQGVLPDDVRGY
jgi:ribulose-5-phosphate 4-epimerase/fuculose-1-phosphate aldolase